MINCRIFCKAFFWKANFCACLCVKCFIRDIKQTSFFSTLEKRLLVAIFLRLIVYPSKIEDNFGNYGNWPQRGKSHLSRGFSHPLCFTLSFPCPREDTEVSSVILSLTIRLWMLTIFIRVPCEEIAVCKEFTVQV